MDYRQMLEDLKHIEKETIELKSSFNDMDAIGRTMAAFSTQKGGKIYVGVDDNGCPIGVKCNKDIKDRLLTLSRVVSPSAIISIELLKHDLKEELYVACIKVEKGFDVYSYKLIPYQRRGSINHPLSTDEAFEIKKNIKKIYFDDLPANCEERPAVITDIDIDKVKTFLNAVKGIKENFDLKRFLQNHNLMVNGNLQVKNAAIMIFGKNTNKFIPHNKISICEFPSTEVTENFIKTEIDGDLISMLQRAIFEIEKRMTVYSFVKGFQRIDVPEYPQEAIREALINAIVHRDYFENNTETFIKIFKDRIELLNPAGFPFQNWTWEEIERTGISVRRNPTVAGFFEDFKLMEQEGRGLTRIKLAIEKHGLPKPKIEAGQKTFRIIFYNSKQNPQSILNSPYRVVRDATGLNERQKKFLEHIQKIKINAVSRKEYMELLTVNEKMASRDLNDLVKRGILQRYGSKRGTKYAVI